MKSNQFIASAALLRMGSILYGPSANEVLGLVRDGAARAPKLASALDLSAADAGKSAIAFADYLECLARQARLLQQRLELETEVADAYPET